MLPNMGQEGRRSGDGMPPRLETSRDCSKAEAVTRHEAADYIASLLEGLKVLAKSAGLPFVAYLLAVTIEAAQAEKSQDD